MNIATNTAENTDDGAGFHELGVDEALERVDASRDGLSSEQASRRLDEHGPNQLAEQTTTSAWQVALNQFTSPLVYVLLAALVITAVLAKWSDVIVISIVLAVNGTVGFWQEYQAKSAVESLMELVSPTATVRRDGNEQTIDAAELVPGDIVQLDQGVVVPADLRLIDANGLRIDESPLTGESVPVDKSTDPIDEPDLPAADQRNMAFMSTAVTSGGGTGVVVATGSATQIGQISEQVEHAVTAETPLEARIDQLARYITVAILAIAAVAMGLGLAIGRDLAEMVELAVALSVSAIPAGLPVVVTVALAIGVSRMAERNAIIQQLTAVDTLGSCSVIVSDKTGTLTRNQMTVLRIVAGGGEWDLSDDDDGDGDSRTAISDAVDDDRALCTTLLVGTLCNDAELDAGEPDGEDSDEESAVGDPMEVALLRVATEAGWDPTEVRGRHEERDRVPFQTEQRFMATVNETDDGPLVAIKGAPERIASMCDRRIGSDGEEQSFDEEWATQTSDRLADEGLRVLAFAFGRGDDAADRIRSDEPSGFVFAGLQGLLDPPRDTATDAVDRAHAAGIRTVMVTGDHARTAAAIGRQVHIHHRPGEVDARDEDRDAEDDTPRALTGRELSDLSDDDLDRALADTAIYSRVEPAQKVRIVERLRHGGAVVAVTGDGVNDAPALKTADIGAAMGSGTDVAKEAADMVVTDDDFASIYAAVEEGRTAFRNIRMATFFLLSTGAAEVVFILATLLLDWPLPLLAAQILWLNVVTNGIADVALAFEPADQSLVRRPPRAREEGILTRVLIERLAVVAVWLAAMGLAVFYWQWRIADEDLAVARTVTLTAFVLFQAVHVFNCRSEETSVFRISLLRNRLLFAGVTISLAIHVGAMYFPPTQNLLSLEPMSPQAWAVAIGIGSTAIVVNELHKRFRSADRGTAAGFDRAPQSV